MDYSKRSYRIGNSLYLKLVEGTVG